MTPARASRILAKALPGEQSTTVTTTPLENTGDWKVNGGLKYGTKFIFRKVLD
jgi:hypothetical protein